MIFELIKTRAKTGGNMLNWIETNLPFYMMKENGTTIKVRFNKSCGWWQIIIIGKVKAEMLWFAGQMEVSLSCPREWYL